jgi:hypothetical protein
MPFSRRLDVITDAGETASGNLPLPTLGTVAVIVVAHVSLERSHRLPDTPFGPPWCSDYDHTPARRVGSITKREMRIYHRR